MITLKILMEITLLVKANTTIKSLHSTNRKNKNYKEKENMNRKREKTLTHKQKLNPSRNKKRNSTKKSRMLVIRCPSVAPETNRKRKSTSSKANPTITLFIICLDWWYSFASKNQKYHIRVTPWVLLRNKVFGWAKPRKLCLSIIFLPFKRKNLISFYPQIVLTSYFSTVKKRKKWPTIFQKK